MLKYMYAGLLITGLVLPLGCRSTGAGGGEAAPDDGTRSIVTSCDRVVLTGNVGADEVSSRIVADLRDGSRLDLSSMDEEEFAKVIRKHGHLSVGSRVVIGDQELVCEIEGVTSYRELKRMRKHLEDDEKRVRKFLEGDKKRLQLE